MLAFVVPDCFLVIFVSIISSACTFFIASCGGLWLGLGPTKVSDSSLLLQRSQMQVCLDPGCRGPGSATGIRFEKLSPVSMHSKLDLC